MQKSLKTGLIITLEMGLEKSLNLRQHDNSAKNGQLIELFRGFVELNSIGGLKQVIIRTLTPKGFASNRYNNKKSIVYLAKGSLTAKLGVGDNESIVIIQQGSKFNLIPGIKYTLKNNSSDEALFIEFANTLDENSANEVYERAVELFKNNELNNINSLIGSLNQITLHTLKPGEFGGNHYHDSKRELMCLIKGNLSVYQKSVNGNADFTFYANEGNKFFLWQGITHKLTNEGKVDAVFIEFSNLAFDPKNPMNDVRKASSNQC